MDNTDCVFWKKLLSKIYPIIIALVSFRIASIVLSFIGYFLRNLFDDNFMGLYRFFFNISIGEIIAFIIAIFIYDYLRRHKIVEKNYIFWSILSLILLSFIFIFQVKFSKTEAHILTNYIDVQKNQIKITDEGVLLE